jgi:hypothetical protein
LAAAVSLSQERAARNGFLAGALAHVMRSASSGGER